MSGAVTSLTRQRNDARSDEARRLYVYGGLTYASIARRFGIAISTLHSWANKQNWNSERNAWSAAEAGLTADLVASLKAMGEKARDGDIKSVTALLAVQKHLRHSDDPRRLVAEFASSLVTLLENDGRGETADLIAGYFERAAERLVD